MQKIAEALEWTVAELAIAWVLRRPEVTAAIVGSRSPAQIAQTAIAGSRVLAAGSAAEVDRAIRERESRLAELGTVVRARV